MIPLRILDVWTCPKSESPMVLLEDEARACWLGFYLPMNEANRLARTLGKTGCSSVPVFDLLSAPGCGERLPSPDRRRGRWWFAWPASSCVRAYTRARPRRSAQPSCIHLWALARFRPDRIVLPRGMLAKRSGASTMGAVWS
jgi:hypothetical protein